MKATKRVVDKTLKGPKHASVSNETLRRKKDKSILIILLKITNNKKCPNKKKKTASFQIINLIALTHHKTIRSTKSTGLTILKKFTNIL